MLCFIFIMLADWYYSSWVEMSAHSNTLPSLPTSLCSYFLMLILSGEATNINCIVWFDTRGSNPPSIAPEVARFIITPPIVCWLCTVSTLTWIPLVDLTTNEFTHVLLTQDRKCRNHLLHHEFSFNEDLVGFWVTIQTNLCVNQQVTNFGYNVCANHVVVVYKNDMHTKLCVESKPTRQLCPHHRTTHYCPSWNMMAILRQNSNGLTNILVSNYKNPIEMVMWKLILVCLWLNEDKLMWQRNGCLQIRKGCVLLKAFQCVVIRPVPVSLQESCIINYCYLPLVACHSEFSLPYFCISMFP